MRNALSFTSTLLVLVLLGACDGRTKKDPPQQIIELNRSGKSDGKTQDVPQSKTAEAQETTRALPTQAVRLGDAQVRLLAPRIDVVHLRDLTGGPATVSSKTYLIVVVNISNVNQTKRVTYKTWTQDHLDLKNSLASVRDNFGNVCKKIDFGNSMRPIGTKRLSHKSCFAPKTTSFPVIFRENPGLWDSL